MSTTTVRGIRYGHHAGPCREAGIAAGELAACINSGSAVRDAAHVVGPADDVRADVVSRQLGESADPAALARAKAWLDLGAEVSAHGARSHLCDCRARAWAAHRDEQRAAELGGAIEVATRAYLGLPAA